MNLYEDDADSINAFLMPGESNCEKPTSNSGNNPVMEVGFDGDLAQSHEFLGSQVGQGDILVYTMSV